MRLAPLTIFSENNQYSAVMHGPEHETETIKTTVNTEVIIALINLFGHSENVMSEILTY